MQLKSPKSCKPFNWKYFERLTEERDKENDLKTKWIQYRTYGLISGSLPLAKFIGLLVSGQQKHSECGRMGRLWFEDCEEVWTTQPDWGWHAEKSGKGLRTGELMGEYIFDKVLFDDMLGLLGLQCSLFISIQVQGCRPQKAPFLISFPLHNHLLPPQPQKL